MLLGLVCSRGSSAFDGVSVGSDDKAHHEPPHRASVKLITEHRCLTPRSRVGRRASEVTGRLPLLRDCCSDTVKAALIIGGAIILAVTIAVSASIYFGAFQTCLRVLRETNEVQFIENRDFIVGACARHAAGVPVN